MRLVGMLVVVLSACAVTPEQRAQDVCNAFCDCFDPTDTMCPAQCVSVIPPVTDACLNCVYANSQRCSDLGDQCTALCTSNPMP